MIGSGKIKRYVCLTRLLHIRHMWLAFRTTLNDRYNLKTSVELKAICDTTVELVNKHLVTPSLLLETCYTTLRLHPIEEREIDKA